jgi:DNA-binding winged helix-turn-helix (wHTH) protein/tetratricopeptide (TPR) repeat protein
MLYVFEDCTLDTRRYELRRAGSLVALDHQVFEVLAYLLAHADQVVSRQELFAHLWPQRFVSDAALERCIAVARRALGDNGRKQRCIKTVHGLGYRFVAAVATRPDAERRPLAPASPLAPSSLHTPAAAQRPAQTVAREGAWEQKPVAVLAIELTWPGLTQPEALGDAPWRVTAAWQHTMVEQVQAFGGGVLQRSPSLLLVAFGTPQTLEQLPQRAVQAALALRQRVVEVPDGGPCPEMRLVGHWGPLLVDVQAPDPTAQLQALGETLAWPVRLLGQAVPGEILVSPELGALVEGWYELEAREVSLAGQPPRPARVYAVVRPKPQWAGLERHRQRPLSRFVGRDQELATLQTLMALVEEGQGQVVGLMGEPGMGKSRLCYEGIRRHLSFPPSTCVTGERACLCYEGITRHLSSPWAHLQTQAVAYGQAVPYLPIIDLLKVYFRLDDPDRAPTIRDKVTATLLALDAALQPTLPALLTLLDVPVEDPHWQALGPPKRRQRLLDAVKRLILRASQAQPLLLIVENLHWIDTETQACLDSLVESLPTARLLLLVTYRPEYQHGWGHKTYYTQLWLDPLTREHIQALLDALLGDEGSLAPLKQRVLVRTQGNPFFVEESVQSLIETGGVVGEPGAYRLGTPSQTLQVPATVQAVLAARIDRLQAEAKHLLQTAAVIGTEAPVPLLQAVAGLDEERLHQGLAQLQAAEFLYETWHLPERAYTFKHALTQEVAYESLVQGRRRTLHARIVKALEALAGDRLDDQGERLAHHALRGEVWDKALAYCRQAGEKALVRSAHREAVGYFEQALAALPHLPESRDTREQAIDLRFALRVALMPSGDLGRILALLREAEALALALDDPPRLGQVSRFLLTYFYLTGDYDQAIAAGQRAFALATASGDVVLRELANQHLGYTYKTRGDYRRAIDCLRQAAAFFDGVRRRERFGAAFLPAVNSRVWLAVCHAELGTFAEGRALAAEGFWIAEAVNHPDSIMSASWGIGLLALRQGDLHRALPLLEQAVSLSQVADLPFYFPLEASTLSAAYTLGGRIADAVPLCTQVMAQMTATARPVYEEVLCRLFLGEAQVLAGHLEEAYPLTERTLALTRERQERGHEAYALRLLGEVAAHRAPPDVEEASAHYRQALAMAEDLGMRPLVAHCHLGLGILYQRVGKREPARTALSTAIQFLRAMEMTFWFPRAEAALAKVA